MTCIWNVPCTKNGRFPTVYAMAKRPTPTLSSVTPYPPILTSTLATLELVNTVPDTRSPDVTDVLSMATERIRGAASGASRGTVGAGTTAALCTGSGFAVTRIAGLGVGAADGEGVGRRTGRGGAVEGAAVGAGCGRLHPVKIAMDVTKIRIPGERTGAGRSRSRPRLRLAVGFVRRRVEPPTQNDRP